MLFDNSPPTVRKNVSMTELESNDWLSAFQQSYIETPLNSIVRTNELLKANVGEGEVKYGMFADAAAAVPFMKMQSHERVPLPVVSKKLDNDAAREQIKEQGLSLTVPEEGYTQKALDIIIDRKKQELTRKAQINDAKGVGNTVGQFAVSNWRADFRSY